MRVLRVVVVLLDRGFAAKCMHQSPINTTDNHNNHHEMFFSCNHRLKSITIQRDLKKIHWLGLRLWLLHSAAVEQRGRAECLVGRGVVRLCRVVVVALLERDDCEEQPMPMVSTYAFRSHNK